MDKNIFDITPQPDPIDTHLDSDCDCADNLTSSWIQIRKIIDEGMKKRDRSVSIYINSESEINAIVYPFIVYDKE